MSPEFLKAAEGGLRSLDAIVHADTRQLHGAARHYIATLQGESRRAAPGRRLARPPARSHGEGGGTEKDAAADGVKKEIESLSLDRGFVEALTRR